MTIYYAAVKWAKDEGPDRRWVANDLEILAADLVIDHGWTPDEVARMFENATGAAYDGADEHSASFDRLMALTSSGEAEAGSDRDEPDSELERNVKTLRECVTHIARGCRSSGRHDSVAYESTIDSRLEAVLAELRAVVAERDALREALAEIAGYANTSSCGDCYTLARAALVAVAAPESEET